MTRKIKSIQLKNFQGHKDNTLELHENLNALVGPSGAGKSTVLKALEWVVFGTVMGESRYGDSIHSHSIKGLTKQGNDTLLDDTFVKITFTDGYSVKKIAGNKSTYYEIERPNEELLTLTKTGGGVPEQVSEIFNFNSVNFANQWEKYFMLFLTPGQIAQELNNYTNMTLPDNILKRINSEAKKANAKVKVIEEDIADKIEELKDYEKLDILEKALDKLQKVCNNLEAVTTEYDYLTEADNKITDYQNKLKLYANVDRLEESLKVLSKVNDDLMQQKDTLLTMDSCLEDWEYLVNELNKYKDLPKLEEKLLLLAEDSKTLDLMESTLEDMLFNKDSLKSIADKLDKYENIDGLLTMLKSLNEVRLELGYVTGEVSEMEADLEQTKVLAGKIKALPSVTNEKLLNNLFEDACKMDELEKLITSMTTDIEATKELSVRLKKLEKDIVDLDKELEGTICPLCGRGDCID